MEQIFYTGEKRTDTAYENESAGLDLVCKSIKDVRHAGGKMWHVLFNTGTKVSIPKGWVGLCAPRSSALRAADSLVVLGIIDVGYAGNIIVSTLYFSRFDNSEKENEVEKDLYDDVIGKSIAQLVVVRNNNTFVHAESAAFESSTQGSKRGENGFGSTTI